MNSSHKNYLLLLCVLIILALEAILFSVGEEKFNLALKNEENKVKIAQDAFADIPIQAKAISVYDATLNKKIYGKNDNLSLPIASLTKIMTIVVALNTHRAEDIVSVSSEAIKQEGDYGFFVNEKFKIKDLAEFTLIGSANDGAYALALNSDEILPKMNEKARKIGMETPFFLNFPGLDINESEAGAYASAEDVNAMALFALKDYPEIFTASVMSEINIKSESGFSHSTKNTNDIIAKIPNLLFSKTGLTPLSGGNLTVIYRDKNGHQIAATVLGSTMEGRFSDMEKIINALYNLEYTSGEKP